MQQTLSKFTSVFVFLITAFCMNAFAQDQSPVRILFDTDSQRIDLMTGNQIPNYTQAQRGSIQFYLGRLDTPVDGVWYFFDGRRFININNLAYMRKMPSLGGWVLHSAGGDIRNPSPAASTTVPTTHERNCVEVWQNAVSFIPLDSNGRPQPKVYVQLNDLELIQLTQYNHWITNDTQKQIREKVGVVF